MSDFAALLLRVVFGSLMAGHGAQKLFGWFGGHGMKGTEGMVEKMGFKPAKPWAYLAGGSEFGSGLLTLLGFLNPIGALGTIGAMSIATFKAHWGKPIWNSSGGPELPVLNMAIALAIGMAGPGKISLDHALGLRLPRRLVLIPGLILTAASIAASLRQSSQNQAANQASAPAEQPSTAPAAQERPAAVSISESPSAAESTESTESTGESADSGDNSMAAPLDSTFGHDAHSV